MKKDRISLRMTLLLLVIISLQSTHVLSKKSKESSNKKSSSKKKTGLTGFIAGRLNPDPALELSRINGFYTPEEASTLCEKNLECAGFTFRGSKNVGQKFRTYFFRFVGQKSFEDAKRAGNWIWTSYRVRRPFVAIFHEKSPKDQSGKSEKMDKNKIDSQSEKGVAQLIKTFEDLKFLQNFNWKFPFSAVTTVTPLFGGKNEVSIGAL